MKLEFLASLLEKDVMELQGTLNLEGDTVPEEVVKETLQNHIKEIAVMKLSEGKKQAEGMAKKKVLSEAEKKLKEKFELTGNTYDELIDSLADKMVSQSDNTGEQLRKEKEALKVKLADYEDRLNRMQQEYELQMNQKTIVDKLNPLLSKYDFATDKVKQLAINDYIQNRKFIVSDGDIFLELDGKPVAYIESDLEKHMLQFAVIKANSAPKPTSVEINDTTSSFGNTISELLKALKTAPVEEREAIKNKIKQLELKKN